MRIARTLDLVGYHTRVGRGRLGGAGRGRLQFVSLCVGSAGLALAAVIATLMVGLSSDRVERMRSLLPVTPEKSQSAALLYRYDLPLLRDRDGVLQPTVAIWISPLTNDAPLPPGVSAWPGPGEAVMSPAARGDLAGYPTDFFGRVVGTVGPEGLELPSERRVYVRPTATALDPDEMTPIAGFGGPHGADGFWGPPTLYATPLLWLLSAVGAFLVVPAAIAIAIGAGLGTETWHRSSRQLRATGAARGHLVIVGASESWRALAVGSLFGLSALLGLSLFDVDLRYLNFILFASDVREWSWAGVGAVAAAYVAGLLLVLGVRVGRQARRRERKAQSLQPVPHRWALACVAAGLLAVWLPEFFIHSTWRNLMYWGAVLFVALTFPAFAAMMLVALREVAASAGRRAGFPEAILAAQRLVARPARTARLIGGVAGAILLLGQVQMFASSLGPIYQGGVDQRASFGDVVLTSHSDDSTGVDSFLANLPRDVEPVWTWSILRQGTSGKHISDYQVFLTGSCVGLRALKIPCQGGEYSVGESTSKALTALSVDVGFGESIRVTRQDVPDLQQLTRTDAQLSLVSTTGHDLPVYQLQKLGNQSVLGGMNLMSLGEAAIAGGTPALYSGRWLTLWGVLGSLPFILATAIALAADAMNAARQTAPLALFPRRAWLAVVSLGEIWLPLTFAGVLGALSYLILPTGMTRSSFGSTVLRPWSAYAWMSALICTLIGATLSYSNYRATVKKASNWQPGG